MPPEWFVAIVACSGEPVSNEQLLVLYLTARDRLAEAAHGTRIAFTHPLCSGTITRGGEGVHMGAKGTYYYAALDLGEHYQLGLIIREGCERLDIPPDKQVVSWLPDPNGIDYSGGKVVSRAVAMLPAAIGIRPNAPTSHERH